jgi:N-formylglutamate amidohydrolase
VPAIPVVAHVPHAGTWIPPGIRATLLLDDAALAQEALVLTDHHTDELFGWLVTLGASALVNQWSRLVLDPERFEDPALEPTERVGQGVVYTRTSDGRPLRAVDAPERGRLVELLYRPWHRMLARLVDEALAAHGTCLVLDCHSFPTTPLPTEADRSPDRPDVCVGTDPVHTPPALADALEHALRDQGFRVRRDSPFAGALVPADHYRRDTRVRSVMLEVRRGIYCDERSGRLLPGWRRVAERLRGAVVAAGLVPERRAG